MGFNKSFTHVQKTLPKSFIIKPQVHSPLFTTLPLEIRHHIYQQLWLDYGLTRHILALTEKSYLLSFPCILSAEELNQGPISPSDPTAPTAPADVDDATAPPDDALGAADNGDADQPQPQSHDDPGDINSALQDLSGGRPELPRSTPWCAHFACFRQCSQKWHHSFSSMYAACYRSNRAWPDLRGSAVLTAFLVCRRMYREASEDLFSKMRFSFSSMAAMDIFLREVPRALVSRVQFVNITTGNMGWLIAKWAPVDSHFIAEEVHDKVKASFPNLRELRLSLHPGETGQHVPQKQDLDPLYALARDMENLRKFEVFLPTKCEVGGEAAYGEAPASLREAPFTIKVVPRGWHEGDICRHFCSTRS